MLRWMCGHTRLATSVSKRAPTEKKYDRNSTKLYSGSCERRTNRDYEKLDQIEISMIKWIEVELRKH